MTRRHLALAALLPLAGAVLITAGSMSSVDVPWSAVFPLALVTAYCAVSVLLPVRRSA